MADISMQDVAAADAMVHLAATGDEVAFARLVAEHHAAMARVAYVICGDAEITRDAVQAAWTTAWRRLRDVKEPSKVRAWLVAVAANEARQAMRRQRRVRLVDLAVATDRIGGGDPADGVAVADLARALRGLKPEDRSLLALRFVAGLDSTEIAAQLGGSPSGVRSRLSRLIERLRSDLDVQDGPRP
jgi:RNA polymerase sigma-70 factor (ECF subfamily)